MSSKPSSFGNRALSNAKRAKNDEFYTQWTDIEREMNAYLEYDPDVFRARLFCFPAMILSGAISPSSSHSTFVTTG